MENYSYGSYAESGDSSPRSREIEFDSVAPATPPPWDNPNYRAKFMCSYGGKILPRPNDNSLCYVGGETKILAVDRTIKLSTMLAKLSALFGCDDVSFKYQLAGEDLDALISVTDDDDFDLMMCEHDRIYRSGARPARMRLFLFPYGTRAGLGPDGPAGFLPDRDMFVEALNLGPVLPETAAAAAALASKTPNTVDYLFGLEKYVAPSAPPAPHVVHASPAVAGRVAGPGVESYAAMHPGDGYHAAVAAAAAAAQKVVPERNLMSAGGAVPIPVVAGYVPEKHVTSGGLPVAVAAAGVGEQPVYVIPASGAVIQPPFVPPAVSHPAAAAAYFAAQMLPRNAAEVYKEKPAAYGVVPTPQPPPSLPISTAPLKILPVSGAPPSIVPPLSAAAAPIIPPLSAAVVPNIPPFSAAAAPPVNVPSHAPKIAAAAAYSEGTTAAAAAVMARTSGGFPVATSEAVPYGPVAYDGTTPRHVYYAAAGQPGMVAPPAAPPMPAVPHSFAAVAGIGVAAARGGGLDSKLVLPKVTQGRVI